MVFTLNNLAVDENDKVAQNGKFPVSYLYLAPQGDDAATLTAAGYFNAKGLQFKVGDRIKIYGQALDCSAWYFISAIDASTGDVTLTIESNTLV